MPPIIPNIVGINPENISSEKRTFTRLPPTPEVMKVKDIDLKFVIPSRIDPSLSINQFYYLPITFVDS